MVTGGVIAADRGVIDVLLSTHHNVSIVDASMGVTQFIGKNILLDEVSLNDYLNLSQAVDIDNWNIEAVSDPRKGGHPSIPL